jgi:DNA-binding transcriptional MocR family regulator
LPEDREWNDVEIATAAAAKRLWLWPLSPAYIGEKKRQGFILGFGNVEAGEIGLAVKTMKSVVR